MSEKKTERVNKTPWEIMEKVIKRRKEKPPGAERLNKTPQELYRAGRTKRVNKTPEQIMEKVIKELEEKKRILARHTTADLLRELGRRDASAD